MRLNRSARDKNISLSTFKSYHGFLFGFGPELWLGHSNPGICFESRFKYITFLCGTVAPTALNKDRCETDFTCISSCGRTRLYILNKPQRESKWKRLNFMTYKSIRWLFIWAKITLMSWMCSLFKKIDLPWRG